MLDEHRTNFINIVKWFLLATVIGALVGVRGLLKNLGRLYCVAQRDSALLFGLTRFPIYSGPFGAQNRQGG